VKRGEEITDQAREKGKKKKPQFTRKKKTVHSHRKGNRPWVLDRENILENVNIGRRKVKVNRRRWEGGGEKSSLSKKKKRNSRKRKAAAYHANQGIVGYIEG